MEAAVADIRANGRAGRRAYGKSVTAAIRAVVGSAAVENLNPGNHDDFLADLLLLAALRELEGDKVLAAAGIARLARLSPGRPRPEGEEWAPVALRPVGLH